VPVFISRKLLNETISPITAKAYQRSVGYFWAWVKITYKVRTRTYPVPVPWLVKFIQQHIDDGVPQKVSAQIAAGGNRAVASTLSLSSIRSILVPISIEHTIRGVTNNTRHPAIGFVIKRLKRRPDYKKRVFLPITADVLVKMLATCGNDLRGERDKAIMLVGFAGGGRRRSEIAGLTLKHLQKTDEGYIARIPNHKTRGFTHEPLIFPIFDNAAKQLDRWLASSGIKDGKVFRSIDKHGNISQHFDGQSVVRVLRVALERAGYPPRLYSAHSLRYGFMTQTAKERIALTDAMAISGHRNSEAATRYYRVGNIVDNPAAHLSAKIGIPVRK
jgi:integrase